jgi:hypothetical protein
VRTHLLLLTLTPACSCVYICKFQFRPIHPPSRRLSTLHLLVCLYSAAGEKVNRQVFRTGRTVARTHWMVGHRTREGESSGRAYLLHGGTISRSEYCDRFSATSSGKVFFGPSALRSLGDFFTDQARYEKRSSTAKGILLGLCFITEDPVRRNTFGRSSQKQCRSYHP